MAGPHLRIYQASTWGGLISKNEELKTKRTSQGKLELFQSPRA